MPRYRAGSLRTRLLLAVLAAVSLVALFTTRVSRKMPDFEVYWTAGIARDCGPSLCTGPKYGHFQFKYLPAFAIMAAPLALLPVNAAKAFWFAASAVLMLVLLGLSVRALPEPRRPVVVLLVLTFWQWRSSMRTSSCSGRSICCSRCSWFLRWWKCAGGANGLPGS
jgi:hypothetical protein